MVKEVIWTFALCLILTLVFEETAALISGIRKGFDLAVIFFTNTLTNPVVVFADMLLYTYTSVPRPVYVIILESAVFITEALIFRKLLFARKPNAFLLSLILNGASFVLGTPLAFLIFKYLI